MSSPERVEAQTRAWLEARYFEGVARHGDPAQTVFDAGGEPCNLTAYQFQALHRKLKIFRWMEHLRCTSFIDIGSGFDFYPWLFSQRHGVPAYYSDMNHAMNMPFFSEASGKVGHAITCNLSSLPFPDGAFDVVIASEVLEHLVRPVEAISELLRITRVCLIMTSLEAMVPTRWGRWLAHHRVDTRIPHVERNFFLPAEMRALFGPRLQHENLFFTPDMPINPFAPGDAQQAVYGAFDRAGLVQALARGVREQAHMPGAMGVLLVVPRADPPPAPPDRAADAELAGWLVDHVAALEHANCASFERFWQGTAAIPERDSPIEAGLIARLCCPDCRAALDPHGAGLRCRACGSTFDGHYGVPVLFPHGGAEMVSAECVERLCGTDSARRRLVRRLQRRLRRNERPPSRLRQQLWAWERHLPLP
ncbi:MAG: methyltransferase domain-containing protein [Candidatus Binatia bacterium]